MHDLVGQSENTTPIGSGIPMICPHCSETIDGRKDGMCRAEREHFFGQGVKTYSCDGCRDYYERHRRERGQEYQWLVPCRKCNGWRHLLVSPDGVVTQIKGMA